MPSKKDNPLPSNGIQDHLKKYQTVALLLQGGGALGAYQAGVYEGLAEANIIPNWIAGISIGALNTALIAGNAPHERVEKLRKFWSTICHPAYFQPTAELIQSWVEKSGGDTRKIFNIYEAGRAIVEGQRDFFVPRLFPAWLINSQPPNLVSFYDTTPLKSTLENLVDFDRINSRETRVSVAAVDIQSGNLHYFDNYRIRLTADHFIASGALPPGFPATEIDGRFYWDGGLVSNTPLAYVIDERPRQDTIAFQVDLWSAKGELPTNIFDVQERQKDIQYSSRTRAVTNQLKQEQLYRHLLREVLAEVPPEIAKNSPACQKAHEEANNRSYNIIHLIYQDKDWDGLAKDYEFSPLTMRNHWDSGLSDMRATLEEHPEWLEPPKGEVEFVTHDLHRTRSYPFSSN